LEEYSVSFEDIHGYKEVSPPTTQVYLSSGLYSAAMDYEYPLEVYSAPSRGEGRMVELVNGGSIESTTRLGRMRKAIISLFKWGNT
jgi:hypothetical protein